MEKAAEETVLQEGKRAARRPARGSPAGLLLFTGFAFGAAAVALALIPRFAPDFNWAVKKLARMGVTSAPIGAAGCAIFALGLVSRGQSRVLAILNEVNQAEGRRMVVLYDARSPSIRPVALAALAEDLPDSARVVLWGVSSETYNQMLGVSSGVAKWLVCGKDFTTHDVVAQCARIVG